MDKNSIARLVLFVLAWLNSFLASKGLKTIPVLDQSQIAMGITFAVTAYTFYKNNFIGKKGKALANEIVKDSEVVIEKVVESKVSPQPEVVKPEPTVIPVAPSNQPIQPAPVAPAEPVAQPEQPAESAPVAPTENK